MCFGLCGHLCLPSYDEIVQLATVKKLALVEFELNWLGVSGHDGLNPVAQNQRQL